MPKIIAISGLRQKAGDLVKTPSRSGQPVFITQRGQPAVVMVSAEVYEEIRHELCPKLQRTTTAGASATGGMPP